MLGSLNWTWELRYSLGLACFLGSWLHFTLLFHLDSWCVDTGQPASEKQCLPPIMTITDPIVDLSWLLCSMTLSKMTVHKSVNLLSAMNMGTFSPAVPAMQYLVKWEHKGRANQTGICFVCDLAVQNYEARMTYNIQSLELYKYS